jgi:hypothetical protein
MRLVSPKIVALSLLQVLLLGHAQADRANNWCPSGTCVVNHPVYVNVFWDSTSNWDHDVDAPVSGMGKASINAITEALIKSQYFHPLKGNYKVHAPKWGGSMTPTCEAPPPDVDTAIDKMNDMVQCVLGEDPSLNNENTILNVFLPPQTVNLGFCDHDSKGHHAMAMHGEWGSSIKVTVIPTNSVCISGFNMLVEALTHEMVEAATDPNPHSPTGWKGEIGDFCENTHVPFLFGSATEYWSNSANACINGIPSTLPVITTMGACGTGKKMQVVLGGTFGDTPWDLESNKFNGQTLYLSAAISGHHTWSAGNIEGLPPDKVGLGNIYWSQGIPPATDTIDVQGYDSKYGTAGQIVEPGDMVSVKVFLPATGLFVIRSISAPSPAIISLEGYVNWIAAGDTQDINGEVLGGSGTFPAGSCSTGPIDNAAVTLTATSGSFTHNNLVAADGSYKSKYVADVAGIVKLKAQSGSAVANSIPISVYPKLKSLSKKFGPTTGGQAVTLTGKGFDGSTSVSFSASASSGPSAAATVTVVSSDHITVSMNTPPSPLSGDGTGQAFVGAKVNGIAGGSLHYYYIIPGTPFLTKDEPKCSNQNPPPVKLTVGVYKADGSLDPVSIKMTSPDPVFKKNNLPAKTLTVQSGDTITATATAAGGVLDITVSNNSTQASTTVQLPTDVIPCTLPTPSAEIPVWRAVVIPESDPHVVTWQNEASASAADYVMMTGPAVDLAGKYVVKGVSGPNTAGGQQDIGAGSEGSKRQPPKETFLKMIVVEEMEHPDSEVPIKDSAKISFVIPAYAGKQYRVMRYKQEKNGITWVPVKNTTVDYEHGQVQAVVSETGTYALVSAQR